MMARLNVNIKSSALYRPQSMGMIERQHRSIKDSLKASIQDLAEKHQDRWLDYLPFIVLGKNSTLQPDVGASPNELAFGSNLRIPGQLLQDPGEVPGAEDLKNLLQDVRARTARPAVQPSSITHQKSLSQTFLPGHTRLYPSTQDYGPSSSI